MSVNTTTHVNFRGQAREALSFYQSVFDGEISIATYADIHAVEEDGELDHVAPAPSPLSTACSPHRYGITWIVGADTASQSN